MFPYQETAILARKRMKTGFRIELLPPAVTFLETTESKAREQIYRNMRQVQLVNNVELLKKLNDRIWEFRTSYGGIAYRLLAFRDVTDPLQPIMIVTHGFKKKTAKTPLREIRRAMLAERRYFRK